MELFSPGHLIVLLIIAGFIFFGWKQLPDMARSVGKSLHIFKAEMTGEDEKAEKANGTVNSVAAATMPSVEPAAPPAAVAPAVSAAAPVPPVAEAVTPPVAAAPVAPVPAPPVAAEPAAPVAQPVVEQPAPAPSADQIA